MGGGVGYFDALGSVGGSDGPMGGGGGGGFFLFLGVLGVGGGPLGGGGGGMGYFHA